MSALLEISGLEVAYGPSQVLFGIDLNMADGEAATLLGRNGMGKTTTLRAICGLQPVKAGSIRFAGEEITGWRPDRIGRAGIALVPEGRQCFPNLTVDEHLVAFFANRRGVRTPWTPARVYDLFPRLQERKKNLGNQLSGGEQQMLAIGRALMSKPRLLLLDEPSLGLAPIVIQQIFDTIEQLRQKGMTIFLVEQNANQALKLADRGYVLENGRVVLQDTGEALLANPAVRQAYLGG